MSTRMKMLAVGILAAALAVGCGGGDDQAAQDAEAPAATTAASAVTDTGAEEAPAEEAPATDATEEAAGGSPYEARGTAKTVEISVPASVSDAEPIMLTVNVPEGSFTMGIASPLHADPGQAAMDTANERIAELLGAESVLEDANLDPNRHVQIADSMLARGLDVITTDILFPKSLDRFLADAHEQGVPVCVEFSDRAGGAQEDWQQAGEEMAAYLNEQFPDGAEGAWLGNTPAPVILNREQGFFDALKSYPGLKIVVKKRNLKETVDSAREIAENMLQSNPDLQFIWTTNDQGALGAGLAAEALGKDIVIIGMNGTPEAVDAVKSGLIDATWDSNQNLMGAIVAVNCVNWLATGVPPESQHVPFTKITAENADLWIPWADRPQLTQVAE